VLLGEEEAAKGESKAKHSENEHENEHENKNETRRLYMTIMNYDPLP